MKECEKLNKYVDLARELKKLWNMKVTIIPIAIGAIGSVTKELARGLNNNNNNNNNNKWNNPLKRFKFTQ